MAIEESITPITDIQVEDKSSEKEEEPKTKRPVTKEKLRSIMEAASALTALGDEDEEGSEAGSKKEGDDDEEGADGEDGEDDGSGKRFIPDHKKPDAALTFPEKLMSMMKTADKEDTDEYCIAWLVDGKSFVVRNPDEFTRKVLPNYFKATKFSSFTRKLYRWGFRQVNRGIGPDDPIIFGNEYFQRDDAELMVKMRSITAAGTRKAQTMEQAQIEIEQQRNKRPLEMNMMEEQRKRMFLEQMINQHKFGLPQQDQPNFMQQASLQQSLNLASALRPSMGLQPHQAFKQMNAPSFSPNPLSMYMPPQQQQHQVHAGHQMHHGHQGHNGGSGAPPQQQQPQMPQPNQPYNSASTAEIVNAAINALRYAS
mmetsp:Transcript_16760/g.27808  ORF Transcript_16760/g.27808 Transcript_16760/m.27808 type:complete len:368 (+) Transcript_16760:89-1192(+)|eukprot:CAMPEP_0119003920 /NCGR_PEP_ID=MMETSP1176-20130426/840_1 /TAXON_ID=265551 /ORGANISM="Synedropsis recta cf, Strain CCMP1620" /LENGTH=367 /DNA_ID=CAMNT_0006955567 /DNA_START=95 /DNA_END=1198 /DNA_ORIENTATION=+